MSRRNNYVAGYCSVSCTCTRCLRVDYEVVDVGGIDRVEFGREPGVYRGNVKQIIRWATEQEPWTTTEVRY